MQLALKAMKSTGKWSGILRLMTKTTTALQRYSLMEVLLIQSRMKNGLNMWFDKNSLMLPAVRLKHAIPKMNEIYLQL